MAHLVAHNPSISLTPLTLGGSAYDDHDEVSYVLLAFAYSAGTLTGHRRIVLGTTCNTARLSSIPFPKLWSKTHQRHFEKSCGFATIDCYRAA
jgi:hypothetical protein